MSRPTICLSMIVKNEEKDIKRCLESVIPFIDYWVISDTGSTDKTKELIQEIMDKHEVPGELHEHKWKDFSTNRNYALELSREHADFIWFMDADDNFCPNGSDPFSILSDKFELIHMNYLFEDEGITFSRACMMKSDADMEFKGVLHEIIVNTDGSTVSSGLRVNIPQFGHIIARASPLKRNKTERDKYLNDARILSRDLKNSPDNYRSMFYLGQSYQLAGELKKAINAYERRASFPDKGYDEEVYLSLYEIAKMKIGMKRPEPECIDSCVRAWESDYSRIEPIHLAMQYLYLRGRYPYALALGTLAAQYINPSISNAKLEVDVYDYKFPDIYARCIFRCGDSDKAKATLKSFIDSYQGDPSKERAIEELETTLSILSDYDKEKEK